MDELHLDYTEFNLIRTAFIHSSYKGMRHDVVDNERLEFLGDSVLNLILAEISYQDENNYSPSKMTELRKKYVDKDHLSVIFDKLNMKQFIRIPNKFELSIKVKADFVEAFFGAVYMEKGYMVCCNLWLLIQKKISSTD